MPALKTVESEIDFAPLHQQMQRWVDQDYLPCVNTLIMRGTEVLDFKTIGTMDAQRQRPLAEDAIFRMYSNTKIVTSVALMQLFEAGHFKLQDPLANVLPEFGDMRVLLPNATSIEDSQPAASPIQIRHVLSHSAGFSYGFIEPETLIDQTYLASGLNLLAGDEPTLEEICATLAGLPLAYHPGTDWRYSLATDVAARVVEVLSGLRFDNYLKEHILQPLGMSDTDFYVPEEKQDRFVSMFAPVDMFDPSKPGLNLAEDSRTGQYSKPRALLSGGGGLVSSVADYLSFIRMIVNGGEWNGARILNSETLALMRTNQLADGVGVRFPMWDMPGTVFGLGFALKQSVSAAEPAAAQDEYHWGGMAGTHSWMAPQANLTGMCMTQLMPGFWHPFSHEFKAFAYSVANQ